MDWDTDPNLLVDLGRGEHRKWIVMKMPPMPLPEVLWDDLVTQLTRIGFDRWMAREEYRLFGEEPRVWF